MSPPTMDQNLLNFMQFFGNICHPALRRILDPLLIDDYLRTKWIPQPHFDIGVHLVYCKYGSIQLISDIICRATIHVLHNDSITISIHKYEQDGLYLVGLSASDLFIINPCPSCAGKEKVIFFKKSH